MSKRYTPLEEYGVIGDMRSAALISQSGSLDWLCLPDFDSPSVFAAILDAGKGGFWQLAPTGDFTSHHSYVSETNVLSTIFETGSGSAELIDLMPLAEDGPGPGCRVLRIVKGVSGSMTFRCTFAPRLDYARGDTRLEVVTGGVMAWKDDIRLALSCDIKLTTAEFGAEAEFDVREGEMISFHLAWDARRPTDTGTENRLLDQHD